MFKHFWKILVGIGAIIGIVKTQSKQKDPDISTKSGEKQSDKNFIEFTPSENSPADANKNFGRKEDEEIRSPG